MSMVIFNSYVTNDQRVNPIKSHKTTIFPWFSHGFLKQRPHCDRALEIMVFFLGNDPQITLIQVSGSL